MKLPAAAGMRAAHAAGSTKTASLERYLLYVRALYPHLAAVRAFVGRPNGLMRLRFRRFQVWAQQPCCIPFGCNLQALLPIRYFK